MTGCSFSEVLLHVGLLEMFIEMFLAFPLFNEMEYPGNVSIRDQFITRASGLPADGRDDLFDFPDKILFTFR